MTGKQALINTIKVLEILGEKLTVYKDYDGCYYLGSMDGRLRSRITKKEYKLLKEWFLPF